MVLLVMLVALASGAIVFTYERHAVEQARTAMAEGRRQVHDRQYEEATHTFARGLLQVENLPGSSQLALELSKDLSEARRAQAARELHRLADHFRLLYGVNFLPPTVMPEIEASCEALWAKRHVIMDRLLPQAAEPASPIGADVEQLVRVDLLDLAILSTSLRVRRASSDRSSAERRAALLMLDQAEELCGASAVLYYERQRQAEALGLTEVVRTAARGAQELRPQTAWEHYALGRAFLEDQRLDEAETMLRKAVALEPTSLWPQFYQGICALRLTKYEDAVLAFTTCAALAPEVAGCLYNRALAYHGWGRLDRALDDYDAALRLDPSLGVAALNRGMLHCQEKAYPQAFADLELALKRGVDPASVYYNQALVHLAQEQPAPALACLERTLAQQPAHKEARALYERLQSER